MYFNIIYIRSIFIIFLKNNWIQFLYNNHNSII